MRASHAAEAHGALAVAGLGEGAAPRLSGEQHLAHRELEAVFAAHAVGSINASLTVVRA